MFPVLGELLGIEIRSYGLLAAAGMVAGLVVILRAGLRAGIERSKLIDLLLWTVIAGLVGSKLLELLLDTPALIERPWTWVDLLGRPRRVPSALVVWQGGLIYYGGVLGGGLAAWLYARRRGLSVAMVADLFAPALALGHAWGRLGCFLGGCCFGKAASTALGVSFGPASQVYEAHSAMGLLVPPFELTHPLHPVQLYEAGVELVTAGVLLWLLPRRRFSGQLALTYVSCYAVARFVLEVFRGDRNRGFVGEPVALVQLNHWLGLDGGSPTVLSVSQFIALLTLLGCLWLFLLARGAKQHRPGRGRA